jgi:hypothetical protein
MKPFGKCSDAITLFMSSVVFTAAVVAQSGDASSEWKEVAENIAKAESDYAAECSTDPCPKEESSSLHLRRRADFAVARESLEKFHKKWDLDPSLESTLRQLYRLGYLSEKQEDFASAHSYYLTCLSHASIDKNLITQVDKKDVPIKDLCTEGRDRMQCLVGQCPAKIGPTMGIGLASQFGGGRIQLNGSPDWLKTQGICTGGYSQFDSIPEWLRTEEPFTGAASQFNWPPNRLGIGESFTGGTSQIIRPPDEVTIDGFRFGTSETICDYVLRRLKSHDLETRHMTLEQGDRLKRSIAGAHPEFE